MDRACFLGIDEHCALRCCFDSVDGEVGEPAIAFYAYPSNTAKRREIEAAVQALRQKGVPCLLTVASAYGVSKKMLAEADGVIATTEKAFVALQKPCLRARKPRIVLLDFPDMIACAPGQPREGVLHQGFNPACPTMRWKRRILPGAIAYGLTIIAKPKNTQYSVEFQQLIEPEPSKAWGAYAAVSTWATYEEEKQALLLLSAAVAMQPIMFYGGLKQPHQLKLTVKQPTSAAEMSACLEACFRFPHRERDWLLLNRRNAFAQRSPAALYAALNAHGLDAGLQQGHVMVLLSADKQSSALAAFERQTFMGKRLCVMEAEGENTLPQGACVVKTPGDLRTAMQEMSCGYVIRMTDDIPYGDDFLTDMMNAVWNYPGMAIHAARGLGFTKTERPPACNTLLCLQQVNDENALALLHGDALPMPCMQVDTDQMEQPASRLGVAAYSAIQSDALPEAVAPGAPLYMVVANSYPSQGDPYQKMFAHQRVKAYRKRNGMNVVVFSFKRNPSQKGDSYEYDGVRVYTGDVYSLMILIRKLKPRLLLIHFPQRALLNKLCNGEIKIQAIWWLHGGESYPMYTRSYRFSGYREIESADHTRSVMVEKILKNPRIGMIPISHTLQSDLEKAYGISFAQERTIVIHNFINADFYDYQPKTADARYRVVSVKNYSCMVYAGDLVTKVIQELSHRKVFSKLTFTICGSGALFEQQTLPLRAYENVTLCGQFLAPEQLRVLYHEHGLMLMPTRHDTQGVSRDEAMSCGVVPLTNRVGAIPEFVTDECAMIVPAEDVVAMADALEALCGDEALFLRMSRAAAEHVRATSGYEQTIEREVKWIQNFEPKAGEKA